MIKIIKGYYGYKQGGSIIPKSAVNGPFECDKAEEARLVKLGVAEYVSADESNDESEGKPLYTTEMKLAELKEIAKTKGATDEDLKPLNSKAKVIELIEKLLKEAADESNDESEEGESNNDAPDLGDDDGVVE